MEIEYSMRGNVIIYKECQKLKRKKKASLKQLDLKVVHYDG